MSNLEPDPRERLCGGQLDLAPEPVAELFPGRDVPLGKFTTVRRLLPHRDRRMVGAWCFVDHFGPDDIGGRPGMQVPPHPHTGLQTVTWLLDGDILHRDSLGSLQTIRPGQLNLMTSGRGISHAEESPPDHPPVLHGLQLWVALPEGSRDGAPRFDHHPRLPTLREPGLEVTVLVGELAGARSPAVMHSPIVGADVALAAEAEVRLPLEPGFEYAALVMTGDADVAGVPLAQGSLLYLGRGRPDLTLRARAASRLFLLGGEPFQEELVMWWNFVARTHEEIIQAREDWAAGRRFGTVRGYHGDPLPAPPTPTTRLRPRGRTSG